MVAVYTLRVTFACTWLERAIMASCSALMFSLSCMYQLRPSTRTSMTMAQMTSFFIRLFLFLILNCSRRILSCFSLSLRTTSSLIFVFLSSLMVIPSYRHS